MERNFLVKKWKAFLQKAGFREKILEYTDVPKALTDKNVKTGLLMFGAAVAFFGAGIAVDPVFFLLTALCAAVGGFSIYRIHYLVTRGLLEGVQGAVTGIERGGFRKNIRRAYIQTENDLVYRANIGNEHLKCGYIVTYYIASGQGRQENGFIDVETPIAIGVDDMSITGSEEE